MSKTPRYPLWSAKAILLISLPVAIITLLLVSLLSNRSFLTELEITLGIVSFGLFIFLAFGLYRGVRLEKPIQADLDTPSFAAFDPALSFVPVLDAPKLNVDIPNLGDAGDDIVGCLVSILLWIAISIVLVIAFWLLAQLVAFVLPWILLALYWVFYRALRVVFAKSRTCRGKLGLSLGYSLLYTLLYVGWMFVILIGLELLVSWRPGV